MTEPGTCDIFSTAEREWPVKTFYTYKCGYCSEPAHPSLEGLAAHWAVVRHISVEVVR